MKKLYYLLLLMAVSLTITSCDEWDSPYYYDRSIVGSWESYYGYDGYYEYDIYGQDVVRYDFYANYTGRYTYYSWYGLSYVDFYWDIRGNMLYIDYEDGDYEILYYGFDNYGYLLLSLNRHFTQYTAYRPSGIYWEQFKDNAVKQGLEVKKEKSKSIQKETVSAKE